MRLFCCIGLLFWALGLGCMRAPPLPADLLRAQQAERDSNLETALREYESIVAECRKHPRHEAKDPCGTAAFRRAQSLERLDRPSEAASAFLDVRALSTDGRTIARALERAATLYAGPLGQPQEALRLCREIIPRWPDEVAAEDALRLFVELETAAGSSELPAELLRLAEALRAHEVIGSFALYYRARFLEQHGQAAKALSDYDAIWRRFPRGPLFDDALMAAAGLLRAQHRSAEAVERLERLEASFAKSILVGHYNKLLLDEGAILLGEIYLRDLNQPTRAISSLGAFIKRQRTSLLCDDALLLMAEAALRRHAPADAKAHVTPSAEDRAEACRYLSRLRREYPDGNRVRRAALMQTELGCLPGA